MPETAVADRWRLRVELERALAVADRANNAALQQPDGRWTVQGDPTEGALIVAARKAGSRPRRWTRASRGSAEVPVFVRTQVDEHDTYVIPINRNVCSSSRKAHRMYCWHAVPVEVVGEAIGAADEGGAHEILEANEALAEEASADAGGRLPLAYRRMPSKHTEGGSRPSSRISSSSDLIGMMDPPRPEAKDAVARAKSGRAFARS